MKFYSAAIIQTSKKEVIIEFVPEIHKNVPLMDQNVHLFFFFVKNVYHNVLSPAVLLMGV